LDERKAVVKRAEKALGGLWLSVVTQADKNRLVKVEQALRLLDEEQSTAKAEVEAVEWLNYAGYLC